MARYSVLKTQTLKWIPGAFEQIPSVSSEAILCFAHHTRLWISQLRNRQGCQLREFLFSFLTANKQSIHLMPTNIYVFSLWTHLATPCCTACLCISSRALSSSNSFRNCSIFLDSASAFCSAFHTLSTFRSVWGCQLFFKFCLK